MDSDLNNQNNQWELNLDIDDFDLRLTPVLGTIPGIIHHNVIDEGGYRKDNTVGAVLILANISIFSPKPSMHYLNITMRNVVKVFCKDTVLVCGNVTDQEDLYKFDEEALNLALEEEARQARAKHEWLEKCSQNGNVMPKHVLNGNKVKSELTAFAVNVLN
ncbi:hypothetical protein Tco_1099061 [Tanacetum coccineum]